MESGLHGDITCRKISAIFYEKLLRKAQPAAPTPPKRSVSAPNQLQLGKRATKAGGRGPTCKWLGLRHESRRTEHRSKSICKQELAQWSSEAFMISDSWMLATQRFYCDIGKLPMKRCSSFADTIWIPSKHIDTLRL